MQHPRLNSNTLDYNVTGNDKVNEECLDFCNQSLCLLSQGSMLGNDLRPNENLKYHLCQDFDFDKLGFSLDLIGAGSSSILILLLLCDDLSCLIIA